MGFRLFTTPLLLLVLAAQSRCERLAVPVWNDFRYSESVSIRYFQFGHGKQPVVLLHGLAASGLTWLDMLQYLDCDCSIYALDLKGHGGSSKPNDHAYRLEDNAAIVRAFMDARNLHDVVLVGHSYGGAVALRTALDLQSQPERLKALVLIGTPGTKQHFPLTLTALRHEGPARLGEKLTPPELRAWVALRHVYYDKHAVTPVRIAMYSSLWRDPAGNRAMRETGAEFLAHGLNALSPEVHNIGLPALVISGSHDRIVAPKYQKRLADHLQNSRYVTFERCGHVPQEEYPRETADSISTFINGLEPGRRR